MSDNSDAGRQRLSQPPGEAELSGALCEGDLQRARTLIEAGADVRYKRDHGYDAVLDAVHGRGMDPDQQLLELLALLAAHDADLSGVSSYGESGLRVLSRRGRFDAVRLLLDAGADKTQLGWTPLMEAVALGSLADVQAALANGPALEERDWWERTAWLIALHTGDITKAKLLRERGADPTACGRCGRPPLFYAIQGHHPDLLRWLLREGGDVHQTDEFGTTALIEAVENDDLNCVEILLNTGANVETNANGTALGRARTREIIMRLIAAGADPADANQRVILGLRATGDEALAAVTPDEFHRTFAPRFGESNPEWMNNRFWEAMIRCGISAYGALHRFEVAGPVPEPARFGLYTPDRKRTRSRFGGPVWCAQRFGQSLTLLPDGRAVQIGGEHEDYYDPDFCIYNDVFVHGRDASVAIYGYPESVFPPTDFHTATLVGGHIYVIGSLGYQGTRRPGDTPVYRLDIRTLRMDRVDAGGEAPGWIYKHRATAVKSHEIRIWGGKVVTAIGSGESHQENTTCFVLDLERLAWRRESTPRPES
jgi:ankyrin repeat protein